MEEAVRAAVSEALGARAGKTNSAVLAAGPGRAVVRVTGPRGPLVVKVAPAVHVRRRGTGPGRPFGHLVLRPVEGVEWQRVHPTLGADDVRSVHRQLAEAVLALQTISLPGFGELDHGGAAESLLEALHRRADLLLTADRRAAFHALLDREARLFGEDRPTLAHDDLHAANVVVAAAGGGWRLAGLLDWDKAWAGPAESDVARMAFWDGMTGPGFWEVYRAAVPERDGWARRALVHQLLWCLEYDAPTDRHRADTAAVGAALGWP